MVKGAGPQVGKTRELAEEEVERAHDIGMTIEFGPVRLTKACAPFSIREQDVSRMIRDVLNKRSTTYRVVIINHFLLNSLPNFSHHPDHYV